MTLMRWSPRRELWDPFSNLSEIQDEMNRLFSTSLRRLGHPGFEGEYWPTLDVVEHKDNIVVRADLPGLKREDVNVSLQDNLLTIRGERKHEAEKQEDNFHFQERVYGAFTRTVQLPLPVNAAKIEAHFKDGVLEIVLPKSEEAKPKQIDVKVN